MKKVKICAENRGEHADNAKLAHIRTFGALCVLP